MKIAIIGTHSTGKTTLIKLLHCELQMRGITSSILPEFSRLCPFPINEETTLQAQEWIQQQQIKQEIQHYRQSKLLICDRATIDNFAYMYAAANGMDLTAQERRAAEHMASYDLVFKTTKLDIEAEADGIRTTATEFRNKIDKYIEYFLFKHDVARYQLPKTIDYTTHVNFMMDILMQQKNVPTHEKQAALSL